MHKMKRMFILMLMICCLVTVTTAASATEVPTTALRASNVAHDGMVRVLLSSMGYPSTLQITLKSPYLADGVQDVELPAGAQIEVVMSTSTGSMTMYYGGASYDMGKTLVLRRRSSSGTSGLQIAQARKTSNVYPGDLHLSARTSNGAWKLHPIMHVYLEYYLYGVVPYEMGNSSHIEALKAQAIAARTYTVRKMSASGSLYDVTDTTTDQVYNGTPSGADRCKQAVDETKGICLMVDNRLAATFYTTSNGGQTEAILNAWGSKGYTESVVKDDPFDLSSSATTRTAVIYRNNASGSQNADFRQMLNQKVSESLGMNAQVTTISALRLHDPMYDEPSRLYTKMDATVTALASGMQYTRTVTFNIFDELEGIFGMSINSGTNELWYVDETNEGFTLTARRHGHGIGMSHRGAGRMANLGYTHEQILGFYYVGSYRMQHTFTHTLLSSAGSETITVEEKPADIPQAERTTAVVTLDDPDSTVNMRASASTSSTVLTTLAHNSQVIVLSDDGVWCHVRFGNDQGYIMKEFLVYNASDDSGADQPDALPVIGYAYVNTPSGSLNLRNEANSDSFVLAQIPRMSKIAVHQSSSGWTQVSYLAQSGWVMTKYLTMIPDDSEGGDADEYARVTTVSGSLNLRAEASKSSTVLAEIPEGTMIPVLEKTTNWTRTSYAGLSGWVMNAYLTFDDSSDSGDGSLSAASTATVTGGALNLRASRSTSSAIFVQIPDQTVIPVLEKNGDWTRTTYAGHTGWVMSRYLTYSAAPDDDQPETEAPSAQQTAVVTGGGLNLRASQSTSSRILLQIPDRTIITIIESGSSWSKTTYGGQTGWVMSKYLTFTDSGSADTPSDEPAVTPPSEGGSSGDVQTAVVVGGKLNMRTSESTSATIVMRIPDGGTVTVLSRGAVWCRVQYSGQTGFVMTSYLAFTASEASVTAKVTTVSGSLNLRKYAKSGAQVLLQIPQNAYVILHSNLGEWCLVSYNGTTGYVMTKFLTIGNVPEQDTPAMPETPELPGSDSGSSEEGNITTGGAAYVNVSGTLNMRSAPDRSASVRAELLAGAKVHIISYGSAWTTIGVAGLNGYVQTQYLSSVPPDDLPSYARRYVATESGSLNLRMKASSSAGVILTIPRHAQVQLIEHGSTWSRVAYQGVSGYVLTSYLTDTNPAATGQPSDEQPSDGETGDSDMPPTDTGTATPVYDETLTDAAQLMLATVSGASVTLRQWCADDAPAAGTLASAAAATVLQTGDVWCKLQLDANTVGYCRRADIHILNVQ